MPLGVQGDFHSFHITTTYDYLSFPSLSLKRKNRKITKKRGKAMLKFSVEKSLLVSAIAVASRTVAPKSPISALEGIYLRAGVRLMLTGYNLETGITVAVPADVSQMGECVMPAKLFFDIVRKMPDDVITVSVDETYKVSVRCSSSSFTLSCESSDEYPELPDVEEEFGVPVPQKVLRDMIAGTIFSASENATRPIHTGCLFEVEEDSMTMVAIDGYRLALRRFRPEGGFDRTMKFVVPAAGLREVEKILSDSEEDKAIITLGRRHITFRMGDATLVCRILEGEFMDWRKVLRTGDEKMRLVANVSQFASSIDRVSLVVTEKFKSPVRCVFSQNMVDLKTATALGTAHDQCSLAGDGKDLEIGFNCRYLLDALRQVPSQEVTLELTNGLNPIVMTPTDDKDDFTYLILPVRIRSAE